MPSPKVFVTCAVAPEGLHLLMEAGLKVEVFSGEPPPPREVLREKAQESDALLTDVDDIIDGELLASALHLKVVANNAAGYDNLDIAAATERGIALSNTPGVLQESVADFTFGLLIVATRFIVKGDRHVRGGGWKRFDPLPFMGLEVSRRTLGIIGLGQTGLAMARRAQGFSMRVMYHSRTRKAEAEEQYGLEYADLPTLLRTSDFVTLHTPLSQDTYHLIGKEELGLMKPTAILVNTARGKLVDQRALYEALRDGVIAGAALDVTEPEPIPMDDPLLTLLNVILTPHIASATQEAITGMGVTAARNIIAALRGEPMPSCLNSQVFQKKEPV